MLLDLIGARARGARAVGEGARVRCPFTGCTIEDPSRVASGTAVAAKAAGDGEVAARSPLPTVAVCGKICKCNSE
jgi:hypothetical protein